MKKHINFFLCENPMNSRFQYSLKRVLVKNILNKNIPRKEFTSQKIRDTNSFSCPLTIFFVIINLQIFMQSKQYKMYHIKHILLIYYYYYLYS